MSLSKVRAALEKRLAGLAPTLDTAYENQAFTPQPGTPYQAAYLLPATPDNSIQGGAVYFERGIFQVTLRYPMNTGPGAAQARSELLRTHFKRGTTLVEGSIQVIVMQTPSVARGFTDGDRYCIPISISFQSQIET